MGKTRKASLESAGMIATPLEKTKRNEHKGRRVDKQGAGQMAQGFRLTDILDIIRQEGRVTVDDLAARMNVTAQTIRRDLAELDESGQIERVHGGAILRLGTVNIAYQERAALAADEKRAIGQACAGEIPNGAAVFMGIGTTVEAVARALRRHEGLMIVTNNLNIANTLAEFDQNTVVLTGGTLRRADSGLLGPLAEAAVADFRFDIAVLGCSALDARGDVLDYDLAEVAFNRRVLAQARRGWLVSDRSKLTRTAPARVGSLADFDALFTDGPLPAALATRCAEWGTRVVSP